jgi:CBS domain-containing protein
MIKSRISGLPVCNSSGRVIGVITADDLFMVMDMIRSGDVPCSVSGKGERTAPTVEFAMSTNVHKISTNMNLEDIIVTMKYKNAHTLPVVENDELVGVVGRRDVFNNFYAVVKKLCL